MRQILKISWDSGHAVLEICGQVSREECTQEEHLKRTETQNTGNQNIT